MQGTDNSRPAFDMVWTLWRRRKWMAIVVFAMAFSTAASLVLALPSLYRATATVLVEQEQVPETFVRSSVSDELKPRLQVVNQQILSRARLQEMIARFDLYPDLRNISSEAAIERMRRDIQLEIKEVEQRRGGTATVAFELTYQGWDPQVVAQVTNTLGSHYVRENEHIRERQATRTASFLKAQFAGVQKQLREQEQRITAFKNRHLGNLPEQQMANLSMLERMYSQLRMNSDGQLRAMTHRERLLEDMARAGALTPEHSPEGMTVRLIQLRRRLAELRTRYTDKYPDVIHVKAEIAALERQQGQSEVNGERVQVAANMSPMLSRNFEKIEADLSALKREEAQLRQNIVKYQGRVENTPRLEQELQHLTRDYNTTREMYASLLQRYEDAQLAEMLVRQKGEQFRVLNLAIPPKTSAGPNRLRLLLMGLVLSLGLAAGSVFLAEQTDTSFHRVDDLRNFTKVPVLANIPRIITKRDVWRHRLRFSAAVLLIGIGLFVLVRAAFFFAQDNHQLVWMLTQRGA